jgi:hypothetical protein
MVTRHNTHADVPNKEIQKSDPSETSDSLDPSETEGWLTREESGRLLGVAVSTIKNYERRGLLCPQRVSRQDTKGREHVVVMHDPRELTKLRDKLQELTRPTKSANTIDTSTWLTRNESTDALSISIQTLKNYEERGLLHPARVPRRDARGHEQVVVVYDPKELAKLPRGIGRPFSPREPGEIYARCFEMFEQNRAFSDVVIEMRQTSDKVHELYERWLDDSRAIWVLNDEAKKALAQVLGPFASVTELVTLVQQRKTA